MRSPNLYSSDWSESCSSDGSVLCVLTGCYRAVLTGQSSCSKDKIVYFWSDRTGVSPLVKWQIRNCLIMVGSDGRSTLEKFESSVCGFSWNAEYVRSLCQQWPLDPGYKFGPSLFQEVHVDRCISSQGSHSFLTESNSHSAAKACSNCTFSMEVSNYFSIQKRLLFPLIP